MDAPPQLFATPLKQLGNDTEWPNCLKATAPLDAWSSTFSMAELSDNLPDLHCPTLPDEPPLDPQPAQLLPFLPDKPSGVVAWCVRDHVPPVMSACHHAV